MTPRDPFSVLSALASRQRALNPPPADLSAEILDEILGAERPDQSARPTEHGAELRTPPKVSSRKWMLVGGGVIALAACVGTAAVILDGQSRRPEQPIACRAAPTLDADAWIVDSTGDPVDTCAALWQRGQLPDTESTVQAGQAVPPLVGCIGAGGRVEVFPGDMTVCRQLGLDAADRFLTPANEAVAELQTSVIERVNSRPCVTRDDGELIVADLLSASSHLAEWTVRAEQALDGSSCVIADVNSTDAVVYLWPKP